MVTIPPILNKPKNWKSLEDLLISLFKKEIYFPLLREVCKPRTILNSIPNLLSAIKSGTVRYTAGKFSGKFSAEISKDLKKLGAKYNKFTGKWSLSKNKLPLDVVSELQRQTLSDQELRDKIITVLEDMKTKDIVLKLSPEKTFKGIEKTVQIEFARTTGDLRLGQPKLTKVQSQDIADNYTHNLQLYVKDFTDQQIVELRHIVQDHVFKGNRNDELTRKIIQSFEVSERKAKFLAKQESSLLSAKLAQAQYAEIGIDEYLWQAVVGTPAHPTREMHKHLSNESKAGKVFKFSEPPITATDGRRNNPGEDYNCRCTARPVVRAKT